MPTPVGHTLAAATLYLALSPAPRPWGEWRAGLLALAAASAADLDFVAGVVVGDWNRFHQGASHSLVVALGLGLGLASLPLTSLGGWRRRALLFTALALSHLALDLVTRDARPPYGIPLFWPFSSAYVHAPFSVFPFMRRGSWALILSPANWWGPVIELLVLGPPLAVVAFHRLRGHPQRAPAPRGRRPARPASRGAT